jgi:hypothetical protein
MQGTSFGSTALRRISAFYESPFQPGELPSACPDRSQFQYNKKAGTLFRPFCHILH